MLYTQLPGIDVPASRLVFGTAYPDMLEGKPLCSWLDRAFERGFTTYDTAEYYGKAEDIIGEWIATRNNRDKIVLITKGAHPHPIAPRCDPASIREDFEKSLRRLHTDYIDIYMLHRDDPDMPVGSIIETLNEFIDSGKAKLIGASNWSIDRIAQANEYARQHGLKGFSTIQPHYSLAHQFDNPWIGSCTTLAGPQAKADREWIAENGIYVFSYASLAHGFLSGKVKSSDPEGMKALLDDAGQRGYMHPENFTRLQRAEVLAEKKGCSVAQVALAYVLANPLNIMPVLSMSKDTSMLSNIAALDVQLTPEECDWLDLRS